MYAHVRALTWLAADGRQRPACAACLLVCAVSASASAPAQDATVEEKMGHIKDSPAIYTAGKVGAARPGTTAVTV